MKHEVKCCDEPVVTILFSYQALKEQRNFDDEVMGLMPGLKLREIKTKEVSSSTPQRWRAAWRIRSASSRLSLVQLCRAPPTDRQIYFCALTQT